MVDYSEPKYGFPLTVKPVVSDISNIRITVETGDFEKSKKITRYIGEAMMEFDEKEPIDG